MEQHVWVCVGLILAVCVMISCCVVITVVTGRTGDM